MASITYKTVIKNAIDGFNSIQDKIYTNSGQLKESGVNSPSSIGNIIGALNASTLTPSVSVSNGSGTLTGVAPGTSDKFILAKSEYSVIDSQDTTDGTNYYLKVTASGSGTATPKVETTAGLVKALSGTSAVSGTPASVSGSSTKYIKIAKAAAGVSKSGTTSNTNFTPSIDIVKTDGSSYGGVNISGATGTIVRGDATKEPTSGYFLAVKSASQTAKSVTSQANITSAGYAPAGVLGSTSTVKIGLNESNITYIPINAAKFSNGTGKATLTVKESTASITDKVNISGSVAAPQTGTTISTPYFYAFTVASSGSGSSSVKTAGYVPTSANIGTVTVSKSDTTYYVPVTAAAFTTQSVAGTATYDSLSGLTLSTSTKTSGITFRPKATGVSRRGKATTAGYTPLDLIPGDNSGTLTGSTYYVTAVTVPASKTLPTVTLTAGTSSSRTHLTALTINGYTTVDDIQCSGIIENINNDGGIIRNLHDTSHSSGNRITNLYGTTTITNHGVGANTSDVLPSGTKKSGKLTITNNGYDSTYTGTVTITTNTYGTVNIWGTSGDKTVQVANHTVTVDGTTVTNANGDLTTTTPTFAGGAASIKSSSTSATASGLTISDTDTDPGSGIYITTAGKATATRAAVTYTNTAGWFGAHSSATTASAAADSSETTLTTNKYYVTAVSVPKDKTFSVTMDADTVLDTTSDLSITGAAYRNVKVTPAANGTITINGGGDKGVLINGAKGKTVKVDGTTVTNANGDLITSSASTPATTINVTEADITVGSTGTVSGSATASITPSISKSGWITSSNASAGTVTASIDIDLPTAEFSVSGNKVYCSTAGFTAKGSSSAPVGTVSTGTISTLEAGSDISAYTENTTVIVPSKGYLCIGAGYYPATAISLDTMLGGSADTGITAITAGYLRSGFKAYNVDGEEITGSIADCTPSSTYYTTTNTGYGAITANSYITSTSTQYIKKYTGSAASVNGTATYDTLSGLTLSTSDKSSGITFRPKATSVSKRYTVSTAGWIPKGTYGATDGTLTGTTQYVTGVTIAENKTLNSVTINADSTSDTDTKTGTLTTLTNNGIITNYAGSGTISNIGSSSAAATLNITTNTYGTVNIWNTGGDKGVQVANHTVKVDGTTVTNTNGDLTTTTPSFAGGAASIKSSSTSATASGLTISDTDTDPGSGIYITTAGKAKATRTAVTYTNTAGWFGAHSSATTASAAADSSETTLTTNKYYVTAVSVPKDKTFSVTMTADTALDTTSNLSVTGAAYRNVAVTPAANGTITINGGANQGVLINGANGKTVKVDGTTVTDANGDLTTTSRSASTGYVTLTKGAGSVTGSNVTLGTSNTSGISVTGKGTISGTGYGKVSTGTGWITSGTTSSNASASSSETSNEETKYITAITIPENKTLNSVKNNGTITTLNGTGTITNNKAILTITNNGTSSEYGLINIGKNVSDKGYITVNLNESNVTVSENVGSVHIVGGSSGEINIGGENKTIGVVNTGAGDRTDGVPNNIISDWTNFSNGKITKLTNYGEITELYQASTESINIVDKGYGDVTYRKEGQTKAWSITQDSNGNLIFTY